MTEAEARARIEDMTQWQADPPLTSAEIDRLLARARVTDEFGVLVDATGYVDTWTVASIAAAVAAGFQIKAAKVAGASFDVKAGDVEAKRSQRHAALLRQAGGGGRLGVITLTTGLV